MCKKCCHINNVIFKRNGTNQSDRIQLALQPDNVQLHDFSLEDWMLFALHFAKQVNYFSIKNDEKPTGDWQTFFNLIEKSPDEIPDRTKNSYKQLKDSVKELLLAAEKERSLTPHITLFVCFLKLIEFSKNRFNSLTERHLNLFYNDILKIEKQAPVADKVHIIFELAKKVTEQDIPTETKLDADKDSGGKKIIYETNQNFSVNKAAVVALKNTYNNYTALDEFEFKYGNIVNSFDGLGKPLPETVPFWYPFGYTSEEKNYDTLPDANIGFSVASPMFHLKQGDRHVCVTIDFDSKDKLKKWGEVLIDSIEVSYSGEESWQAISLRKEPLLFIEKQHKTKSLITSLTSNKLQLVFKIPKELPAVVGYNTDVLGANFTTKNPIVQFVLKTNHKEGHDFFKTIIKKSIAKITVETSVFGIKNILLENDLGVINANKPFMPFTSQPIKGSSFHIKYPEAFLKKWKTIQINAKWMNTPLSFKSYYSNYKGIDGKEIVTEDNYFKATSNIRYKENWDKENRGVTLFKPDGKQNYLLETIIDTEKQDLDSNTDIKITLNQSFLHTLYPKLYTLAFTLPDKTLKNIPNEPYTPLIETLEIAYAAEESVIFKEGTEESYYNDRIQLFHNDVFGTYQEHKFLKEEAKKNNILTSDTSCYLIPDYCNGGELYIGIENAKPLQHISLLIQILEGSENPKSRPFEGKERVSWAVLCSNYWKPLEDEVLVNEVDNFLKSGIVTIKIPEQANSNNTKFSEQLIWLRAKMHKKYDAVCKVFGIYAQATVATFKNDKNELSHLNNGLQKETISKLVTRIPQVKKIKQPFSSFGGKPEESDKQYYQRVSERLRHKNRAINLWDYEHLILQQFPEVYLVKCLNHTSKTTFMSPGDVLIIVIPDIINRNVFDIYEPRLSTAKLNEIESYINSLNSFHVNASVDNANYERVVVNVKVKFYPQYDENLYKEQLQKDITKLLSPWAFDTSENIVFGVELNSSSVIDYIEKLPYVDYIVGLQLAKVSSEDDLKIYKGNKKVLNKLEFENKIRPSSPKHVLVSAKVHEISTDVQMCNQPKKEKTEQCQY